MRKSLHLLNRLIDALDDLEASNPQWEGDATTNVSHSDSASPLSKAQTKQNEERKTNDEKASNEHILNDNALIDETLDELTHGVANVQQATKDAQGDEDVDMGEFFNQMMEAFGGLSGDSSDENLDNTLKKLMGNFFSVETLKEPIQTINERVSLPFFSKKFHNSDYFTPQMRCPVVFYS